MTIHPSISVHEVCFPASLSVREILSWCEAHGVANAGLFSMRREGNWSAAVRDAVSSPVSIAYLAHASMFRLSEPATWEQSSGELMRTIDAAAEMNCSLVYGTTGPAGRLEFEEAAQCLASAVGPALDHAESRGVRLLIETTQPNFCFTHFVHSFVDTVDVARQAGLGVVLDVWPTWHERGIRKSIEAVAKDLALIQVSDHVPRNTTPSRDIVGTGIIRIEQLLRTAFDAGYSGIVDLELFGRPDETALKDTLESARALTVILDRIGVAREI